MSFDVHLKDFKNKKFPNIVVLHGEEPYFIDKLEAAIEENSLTESEKSFNQTIFYGKESDAMSITDTARRYPMMAERQVVILREAQEMKGLSDLANYLEKPSPTTLFVVCHKHKKLDERTKFAKNLKASGALIFESKKIYENQVADFIINYLAPKKLRIDQVTANLIGAHLGVDLAKIANELDKLALNLPAQTGITAKHVEEFIGISKDYNIFELQKALGTKDILQATKIANYFAVNSKKHPLVMTISGLFTFFLKLWQLKFIENKSENEILVALELRGAWFLKDYSIAAKNYSLPKVSQILSILADFDLRSKGVGSSQPEEELVRELVWLILH
jgi:DNA polymerase III subunit delta